MNAIPVSDVNNIIRTTMFRPREIEKTVLFKKKDLNDSLNGSFKLNNSYCFLKILGFSKIPFQEQIQI
jgi:hypothetical protein